MGFSSTSCSEVGEHNIPRCVTKGEIVGVRFSLTSCSDGGGAQSLGESSTIRLVFWVESGPRPYMLSAPVDLGYVERRLVAASPAGCMPAPRSRTRWTLPVLTIVSSGGPGICGTQTHGNEPGRLQASSKIENSVDSTGSNNCQLRWTWYMWSAGSR